ncbi:hypothetical protein J5226_08365 [Lysobacter sp. K5869]|uniref:hypothetical protein n=1 Tax=Lysobacter sp. K5869 TaxID=2820808 RepID=UPI001C062DA7|nr:hypothetical protein [Lysobacter sp. K5869]QWP78390.1 hypothetical protein J5226_08365 [Lysobacter sp. K5869]
MGFAQGCSAHETAKRLFRVAVLAGVLTALLACGDEPDPSVPEMPGVVAQSRSKMTAAPPTAAAERAQPAPACPSQRFDAFLKAFANSADLQVAFSLHPVRHKYPYYWKHNTPPGDPAHPKWVVDEEAGPARVKYRYDAASDRFVWSGKTLRAGQRWLSLQANETDVSYAALPDFRIRRVSDTQYDVEYDQSDVDTYELSSGCWHFAQRWEREAIVECKWPEECRRQREYEAPMR